MQKKNPTGSKATIVLHNHGSSRNGSTTVAKDATSSNATPAIVVQRANEPICVKPADRITPWQIAHNFPEPWSLFSVASWSTALVNHPDQTFVEALHYNITHGVELDYSRPKSFQSYLNHLSSAWTPAHTLSRSYNVNSNFVAWLVHSFLLLLTRLSDRRWARFPKSARTLLNTRSFTTSRGPGPFYQRLYLSGISFVANTTPSGGQEVLMAKLDLSDSCRSI